MTNIIQNMLVTLVKYAIRQKMKENVCRRLYLILNFTSTMKWRDKHQEEELPLQGCEDEPPRCFDTNLKELILIR